jgi:hypothetical protein
MDPTPGGITELMVKDSLPGRLENSLSHDLPLQSSLGFVVSAVSDFFKME